MKSEQIIKDFWREAEELKNPLKSIGFLERDGVCACNAEMTIEKAKNPREFRSFLLVAFVIDQTMYTFFQNIYGDFRQSFFLPKYWSHGGIGCTAPWGLIVRGQEYDEEKFDYYLRIFAEDIKWWFINNSKISSHTYYAFKELVDSYISSKILQRPSLI